MPSTQELIADLARAFPRQFERMPREEALHTLRVYIRELQDVAPSDLAEAVRELIRACEFFPTVRAIREVVAERALRIPGEAEALAQIDARMRWARDGGHGDAPEVHPLVRDSVRQVGGWHAFRAEDATVVRGQWGRYYRETRAAAIREAQIGRDALAPGTTVRELTA